MTLSCRSLGLIALLVGCTSAPPAADPAAGTYLYVWSSGSDSTRPDYLAVIDATRGDGPYGALLDTIPVPGRHGPHHTEHELAADGRLFANGFGSGQTFIFDVTGGAQVKLAGQFGTHGEYGHPHSFIRLPNGNVLGTFQMRHTDTGMLPGGLVEMTTDGAMVRSSSAMGPGVPLGLRPYSAAIVPSLDRIVTSTTDMDSDNPYKANQLQIWRLSDLALLHTITLPQGPRGNEADYTAEPRLLPDGRTVMVSTFNCGLYLLEGLDGDTPSGRFVASFPLESGKHCAIPVVAGRYWITTVPAYPAVVSLDISDPSQPREASRLMLQPGDEPHWIAMEPGTRRLVLTGYGNLERKVMMLTFDSTTGKLGVDSLFRTVTLPGSSAPHGAVFSREPGSRGSRDPE